MKLIRMVNNLKWIHVEVGLPEVGERVIVCSDVFVGEGYIGFDKTWYRYQGFTANNVIGKITHWAEMPKPYRAKENISNE